MSFKKTKLVLIAFFLFLAICFLGVLIFFRLNASPYEQLSFDGENVKISVPSGTTMRTVAKQLEENNVIKNADVFYLSARFAPVRYLVTGSTKGVSLKSGVYEVRSGMTYAELFDIFSNGRDEYVRTTIPEGYTISMIGKLLEEQGVCSFVSFMDAANDRNLISEYNIASTSLEGYLFPDTYFFSADTDAEKVCRTMVDNFFTRVKEIADISGKSPEELDSLVTLASIVEREYRVADEAPLIASVFKNRIDSNMGLYSCATIVYIITEIEGRPHPDIVTYADLKIDSPYNTYKWASLPPTPISNPGRVALDAVFHTPETKYLYFRVTDADQGRHVFTSTFDEHINEGNLYTKRVGK